MNKKKNSIKKTEKNKSNNIKKETINFRNIMSKLKELFFKILEFIKKLFFDIKNTIIEKKKNLKLKKGNPKETVNLKPKNYIILLISELLLLISLFYISILFIFSLLTILDGVKSYGIAIFFFSLCAINFLFVDMLNKKRLGITYRFRKYFLSLIILLVVMAFGVSYTTYSYFKLDFVNSPDDKYTLSYKELTYKLSKNQKTDLYFNSWYKLNYTVVYDEELKDRVKIGIKYNETFYDLLYRNDEGDIYVSLAFDKRDLFSMYINNLKDNKIYNEKELSRYLVKIYVNKEDYKKLVIHD